MTCDRCHRKVDIRKEMSYSTRDSFWCVDCVVQR